MLIAALALLTAGLAAAAGSSLTLNLSPSVPLGFYVLRPRGIPRQGDVVALSVPPAVRDLVARRGYLPPGYTLLKHVVAVSGDAVCFCDHRFTAHGQLIGTIAPTDTEGRPLVPSTFCGPLPSGMAVIATDADRSFDSRYFGPVAVSTLTVARALWTF